MDYEGGILTVDFGDYYFVNVYTPNAGSELKRLADRSGISSMQITCPPLIVRSL